MRSSSHRFMEHNLSMVINRTPLISVGVSDHIKVHYQSCTMCMQTHQEIYILEIFQNVLSRFPDALHPLWNHPASVDNTETTTSGMSRTQDHTKRRIYFQVKWDSDVLIWRQKLGWILSHNDWNIKEKPEQFATKSKLTKSTYSGAVCTHWFN